MTGHLIDQSGVFPKIASKRLSVEETHAFGMFSLRSESLGTDKPELLKQCVLTQKLNNTPKCIQIRHWKENAINGHNYALLSRVCFSISLIVEWGKETRTLVNKSGS